jgi:hypothetical protein
MVLRKTGGESGNNDLEPVASRYPGAASSSGEVIQDTQASLCRSKGLTTGVRSLMTNLLLCFRDAEKGT